MSIPVELQAAMQNNGLLKLQGYNPKHEGLLGDAGLVVYNEPRYRRITTTRPFFNGAFGDDLAQDGAVGGATEDIHDGGDTVAWTPSIISGTWDFADTTSPDTGTNHISITSANDNDQANFDTGSPVSGTSYSTLRLRVNLQTYNSANNTIMIVFNNGGTQQGISIDIEDYINPSLIGSYQTASIPLSDLEIDGSTIDGCSILIGRTGGSRPTIYFDEIALRGTGGIIFELAPDTGTTFFVQELKFIFIDNVTGSTGKVYNTILGTTLTDGLTINRTTFGQTTVGRSINDICDFTKFGGNISDTSFIDDGTNTMLAFSILFEGETQMLDDDKNDTISITINDDLSGLLKATCYGRGVRISNK